MKTLQNSCPNSNSLVDPFIIVTMRIYERNTKEKLKIMKIWSMEINRDRKKNPKIRCKCIQMQLALKLLLINMLSLDWIRKKSKSLSHRQEKFL